ncbi:MAG: ThiF family adenylyltransferase [Candidatus Methanomethylophilaceae archaeon]|nr:ThiF family adenylyltransferase [Candidatus Methanomethylophilaceae archaeon]
MGRYDRQLLELTEEEQSRISGSSAGIAGCGGLGTTVATALASAGVSAFVLMDPDIPDETNLNRQFAYCEEVLSGNPAPKPLS